VRYRLVDDGRLTRPRSSKVWSAPAGSLPFAPSLEKLYVPSQERIADALREVYAYGR
jgi:hypothetical protein